MLAKVNELNKNVVILLSVLIIAATAVIVTLIATNENNNDPLKDLQNFQQSFNSKYGVKPTVNLTIMPNASEPKTKALAENISDEFDLGAVREDDTLTGWYKANNKERDMSITVISNKK